VGNEHRTLSGVIVVVVKESVSGRVVKTQSYPWGPETPAQFRAVQKRQGLALAKLADSGSFTDDFNPGAQPIVLDVTVVSTAKYSDGQSAVDMTLTWHDLDDRDVAEVEAELTGLLK
jgi:hypothetical protein